MRCSTRSRRSVLLEARRHPVRELQRALQRSVQGRRDAVQALERQAEFTSVLAHELRAPLSPIRNAAALLASSCSPQMNAFVSALLERQTSHASQLVEDLLDVARIRTGRLRLQRSMIDLGEVVAGAIQTCQPDIQSRSQSLVVDTPSQPLWVDGDATRLAQVLNNLLGNASRYTPHGGEIGLAVRSGPQRVTVVVRDSGIGIAAADLPRIFDAYFQHDRAMIHEAAGLGLGLSIVHGLVLAHGGRITAYSDGPGRGSRFETSLPLHPHAALAPDADRG
jgi:signal transduction histidine kinase